MALRLSCTSVIRIMLLFFCFLSHSHPHQLPQTHIGAGELPTWSHQGPPTAHPTWHWPQRLGLSQLLWVHIDGYVDEKCVNVLFGLISTHSSAHPFIQWTSAPDCVCSLQKEGTKSLVEVSDLAWLALWLWMWALVSLPEKGTIGGSIFLTPSLEKIF